MKKRLILSIVSAAAAVSLLAPVAASAAQPACVWIKSGKLNIQVGYAPNGPRDCTRLP